MGAFEEHLTCGAAWPCGGCCWHPGETLPFLELLWILCVAQKLKVTFQESHLQRARSPFLSRWGEKRAHQPTLTTQSSSKPRKRKELPKHRSKRLPWRKGLSQHQRGSPRGRRPPTETPPRTRSRARKNVAPLKAEVSPASSPPSSGGPSLRYPKRTKTLMLLKRREVTRKMQD